MNCPIMGKNLDQYRLDVNRLMDRRVVAQASVTAETKALAMVEAGLADTAEATRIVQAIAQEIQRKVHEKLSGVVRSCLKVVFEDPYDFRIEWDKKRGKTEARLVFSRDGADYDDPLNEIGGGVIDVAALAFRVFVLVASRPKLRRLLILDEAFKNIRGARNRNRTKRMLENLVEEMGFQFVLSTDVEAFRTGTVVEVE